MRAHVTAAGMAAFAIVAAAVASAAPVSAQNFPDHPVKIVVPYPAGGPADTVARVTTQGLGAELGGSVVIENLAGAGGRIATKDVTRAAPDGYRLLLGSSNEYAITPALYQNLDFDPVKDLVPVAPLVTDSIAIVINPSVPVNSLTELAAYANAHAGKLTMGSTLGIAPHLALMYFEKHMHADITFVPYKGAAPGLADAMGNQIQVTSSAKSVLVPLIKAGKLKALAVSSSARWPELPEVPTFAESGLDRFPPTILFGLMAPAATPAPVIGKINAAENARLKSEATQAGIAKLGMYPHIQTSAAFAKELTDDAALWRAVVKESGVHLD
jgi:tripartite-type tricarboxylate transporter receptor subunit TctC